MYLCVFERNPVDDKFPIASEPEGGPGESISYALQCRVPISNKLTINPVYPAQLERVLGEPWGSVGKSISYALQRRVPMPNELTSNPVYPA